MVQSDESLGWRLSSVDMPKEASRLFTPVNEWKTSAKSCSPACDAKSAVTEQDISHAANINERKRRDDTSRKLRSALINSSLPSAREEHDKVDHPVGGVR